MRLLLLRTTAVCAYFDEMSATKGSFFTPKTLFFALACAALAYLIFGKPSPPRFKCEFYDSSKGVVVNVMPLPGYEFPSGDFEVSVSPSGAGSSSAFFGNLAKGSKDFKFKKPDLASGGIWFVCPFEKKIKISIPGLDSVEVYRPGDGKCGKSLP
jgi:hypothetical protein